MPINKTFAALACMFALALPGMAHAAQTSTGQYIDDSAVTARVKADLLADNTLKATDISVATDHGVVKLTGNVDTGAEYAQAAQDTSRVSGVTMVSNMLTVRQTESQ